MLSLNLRGLPRRKDIILLYLIIPLSLLLITVLTAYVCYCMVFKAVRKNKIEEFPMPVGKIYEPYYEEMKGWQLKVRELPQTDVEIKSHDGLTLRGKFYQFSPDAPIELMFHGYRGNSKSDLCGGVLRCFKLGRSVLTVDHRASGESEGKTITFGINESRDCAAWVDYIVNNINSEARIILSGVSMGAATVMIASAMTLPKNVIGVIADCGYTSAKAIIKKVAKEMKLPASLLYPFIKLGARLFGHFNLDELSPIDSVKRSQVPIVFIHGDADAFVPYEMSVENYNACTSKKRLVTVKNAGHGLAYAVDPDLYLKEITAIFDL